MESTNGRSCCLTGLTWKVPATIVWLVKFEPADGVTYSKKAWLTVLSRRTIDDGRLMTTNTLLQYVRRWCLSAEEIERVVVYEWIHISLLCSATTRPWSVRVEWMDTGKAGTWRARGYWWSTGMHPWMYWQAVTVQGNLDHLQGPWTTL